MAATSLNRTSWVAAVTVRFGRKSAISPRRYRQLTFHPTQQPKLPDFVDFAAAAVPVRWPGVSGPAV